MPRIRYTADHNFRINKHVVRAYKAGKEYLVSQAAAAEAFRLGKAKPAEPRGRRTVSPDGEDQ